MEGLWKRIEPRKVWRELTRFQENRGMSSLPDNGRKLEAKKRFVEREMNNQESTESKDDSLPIGGKPESLVQPPATNAPWSEKVRKAFHLFHSMLPSLANAQRLQFFATQAKRNQEEFEHKVGRGEGIPPSFLLFLFFFFCSPCVVRDTHNAMHKFHPGFLVCSRAYAGQVWQRSAAQWRGTQGMPDSVRHWSLHPSIPFASFTWEEKLCCGCSKSLQEKQITRMTFSHGQVWKLIRIDLFVCLLLLLSLLSLLT